MIALEVETTGTHPYKHSILAMGAIDLDDTTRQFYGECAMWDGAHLEDKALEVNGLTEAEVRDPVRGTEDALVKDFLAWAGDCPTWNIVGQSPSFDRDFVREACARYHFDYFFPVRTIDTHTLCIMHMVRRGINPPISREHHRTDLSLDAVLEYCGIPPEPKPHNGLNGALRHAEVYSRLLYNKPLLDEFKSFGMPW